METLANCNCIFVCSAVNLKKKKKKNRNAATSIFFFRRRRFCNISQDIFTLHGAFQWNFVQWYIKELAVKQQPDCQSACLPLPSVFVSAEHKNVDFFFNFAIVCGILAAHSRYCGCLPRKSLFALPAAYPLVWPPGRVVMVAFSQLASAKTVKKVLNLHVQLWMCAGQCVRCCYRCGVDWQLG